MDKDLEKAPTTKHRKRARDRLLAGANLNQSNATVFAEPAPGTEPVLDSSGVTVDRLRYEEEQAYYNELYLLAPVGYFLVGFDSQILQANLVGAAMLGIERVNAPAHHFRSFIAPGFLHDYDRLLLCCLPLTRCAIRGQ